MHNKNLGPNAANMSNRQTDRHTHTHTPCYSVYSNRPHLDVAAMLPNNKEIRWNKLE